MAINAAACLYFGMQRVSLTMILCLLFASPIWAANKVAVELIPSQMQIKPGQSFQIAIRFKIDPKWHLYWINPGDSGLAPSVQWTLPKGVTISSKLHFPPPHRLQAAENVESFAYENELILLADAMTDASVKQNVKIDGKIDWLVCNDVCIAESANTSVDITIGEPNALNPNFAQWRSQAATPAKDVKSGVSLNADKSAGYLYAYLPADQADLSKVDLLPPAVEDAIFDKPAIKTDANGSAITIPFRVLPGMTEPVTGEGMLIRTAADGSRKGELVSYTFNFVK